MSEDDELDPGGREITGAELRNVNVAIHSLRDRGVEVIVIHGEEEKGEKN